MEPYSGQESTTRPFGLTIISLAMIVNAAIAGIRVYIDGRSGWELFALENSFQLAGLALGIAGLFASVGLWRLRHWAWVVTMIWAGANMTHALYGYIWAEPQYVEMALSVVAVLYLNQRDVQIEFIESTKGVIRGE